MNYCLSVWDVARFYNQKYNGGEYTLPKIWCQYEFLHGIVMMIVQYVIICKEKGMLTDIIETWE